MNFEEGMRVRSTESRYPELTEGTYRGRDGRWYLVEWDGMHFPPGPWLHALGEFEAIE